MQGLRKFHKRSFVQTLKIVNDLLANEQFGFCKGRSCITQLLVTIDDWMKSLDKNIPLDAVYLDFRKAFDTVPHKRLIHKLEGYGVSGDVLGWILDFLTNRYQYVSVDGKKSGKIRVTSGVPQGSVLGPILFIYFINDLPSVTENPMKMFADDTKTYNEMCNHDDQQKVQACIDIMVDWTIKWLVGFNGGKCKVLHLGSNNPHYKYYIRDGDKIVELQETKCEKDLGVHVDNLLNFQEHIDTVTKKARATAGMIMRNITFKSPEIMIPLYKALIRPVIEYGNCVWYPHLKKDIETLERVQRNYTKNIIGMRELSYEERLSRLKLPSLVYRRVRGDMIEVYKIIHNLYDPKTTSQLLTLVSDDAPHTRTNSLKLTKHRTHHNLYSKFFTNRVINTWNSLPHDIVNAPSLNSFKNKIDKHFKNVMYTTE